MTMYRFKIFGIPIFTIEKVKVVENITTQTIEPSPEPELYFMHGHVRKNGHRVRGHFRKKRGPAKKNNGNSI